MARNGWLVAAGWVLFGALMPGLAAPSSSPFRAGVPYAVNHWDTEAGLPNNEVLAVTQTRDGYLWLGTLNGLVRFDGINFVVFDENNTPGLNSSRIVHLFEDSQGNLWIGTETAGVAVMKEGTVTSRPEIPAGGLEKRLTAACEDATGAVWLYLANGDLWRCQRGNYKKVELSSPRDSHLRAVIAEPGGPIWVGTDYRQTAVGSTPENATAERQLDREIRFGKLDYLLASRLGGYWRLADGRIQKLTTKGSTDQVEHDWGNYPWSADTRVSAACEDRQGNLLVGTLGAGAFWYDAEGKVTSLSTNEGLSDNYVLSLYVDHEGALWVGTDSGGLNRVRRQVFAVLDETRGLTVLSASEDSERGLWIGFNSIGSNAFGVGLWKDGVLQRFGRTEGLLYPTVWSVLADRDNQVWAGTIVGLSQFRKDHFQRVAGGQVFAIHQDRANRLWLGMRGGLVCWDTREAFTIRNGLSADEVRAIADDPEGNLWIGTRGGGLNRLRNSQFSSFHKRDGLPSEDVSSLYVDGAGVLWIGTFGSGLARYHRGQWTRYTTREGMIGNSVGYLVEDGQGYLWIGSNRGLVRAPKKALNDFANNLTTFIPFRAYGKPDGLPTSECTLGSQPGACQTRDGKLWFPTSKGLAWIDPVAFRVNTNPPPVVIESVLIDGEEVNTNRMQVEWPEAVVVPAGKEDLEIHYTSLNLAAPDQARFKYRLEEHESKWTEVGNTRMVHYIGLRPGRYHFRVTACNEDGLWNEAGTLLALIVKPPFWQTWWFLTATVAGLLGTVVAVVHYVSTQRLQRQLQQLQQQEALEKERARIARDIHDQLGASLTQVSLLGEFVETDKHSPSDVEAHAKQICQTARDTTRVLDEIVWTVNPSNDTLDGLINYVCKYAQDYLAVAGLRYRLDVPAHLPDTPIPPELRHNVFLAAKEAVTNVVRHAKASSVWIRLRLEPVAFILEIADDGRGVGGMDEKAASARNGLRNMRKRMEDIGGTFTIGPAAEGGALVRLTGPLRIG